MENVADEQSLPSSNNSEIPTAESFARLLPTLYYSVNRILEDCWPAFSKKVGLVLLALDSSTMTDNEGKYLTVGDIARLFRQGFVVSESSVKSEASKVKNDLFALNFIRIEGGKDHIHLTPKGEAEARRLLTTATGMVEETLKVLDLGEQRQLLNFAARMLVRAKTPEEGVQSGDANAHEKKSQGTGMGKKIAG
jgi:hypothetical protein